MKRTPLLLLIAFLAMIHSAFADVRINEIMSSNGETIADEDGDFPDWIELTNTGSEVIDLSGWGLSDSDTNLSKWLFPDGATIAPGEFMLVWASGKDRKGFSGGDFDEEWADQFPDAAGLWKFAEASNAGFDHSIHANHGTTVRDPRSFNLGFAHALRFERVQEQEFRIPSTSSLQITGNQTLSMWLKPSSIGFSHSPWHKRRGGEGSITLVSDGHLQYYWGTSGTNSQPFQSLRSGSPLVVDEWHHITLVRDLDQGQVRWYLNGELDASANASFPQSAATNFQIQIGNGSNGYFDGFLSMLVMLPRALDPAEVATHHEKTRGAFSRRMHTNFSISSAGEPVVLTRPDGSVADLLPPVALPRDHSFGRDGDGESRVFTEPSPLKANPAEGYLGVLSPPVFSHTGGFHVEEFDLAFAAPPGATVHYTLDGSEPAASRIGGGTYHYKDSYPTPAGAPYGDLLEGTMETRIYDSPLRIRDRTVEPNRLSGIATQFASQPRAPAGNLRKATVVRAWSVREGYLSSEIVTRTYFVNPDIMTQYDLPVISISTDDTHLFGYEEGIYVPGQIADQWRARFPGFNPPLWQVEANYWQQGRDWERPAHFEYYRPDGNLEFATNLGVRLHGGASRASYRKSLRLYPRSDYQQGGGAMDYPFFPGLTANGDPQKSLDSFGHLILRNGGNHSGGTLYHDALLQDLISHRPLDTQAWQPAMHYINGESWGIINLRERIDSDYIESHYGIHENDVSILDGVHGSLTDGVRTGQIQYSSFIISIEASDPDAPETWNTVEATIDIDNHALYYAFQILIGNSDWPQNNIAFWKKLTPDTRPEASPYHDGRWRWAVIDTDQGFRTEVLQSNSLARIANPASGSTIFGSTRLFRMLMRDERYHRLLANHLADLMNSSFLPSRVHSRVDDFNALMAHSRAEHFQRWQASGNVNDGGQMKTFATERPDIVRQHVVDYFGLTGTADVTLNTPVPDRGSIQMNALRIDRTLPGLTEPTQPYPWTGTYFEGVPVKLTAIPEPGHRFVGWSELPGEESPEIEVTLTGDATFTALFEELPPEPTRAAVHAWDFESEAGFAVPSLSLVPGASLVVAPGFATEVLRSAASQNFTTAHLRVNNPIGATATFSLPTTGFESITLDFDTRRSGQGAGSQTLSYTVNGNDWIEHGTYEIADAAPQPQFFDFSGIEEVNDNPEFAVRITFAQSQAQLDANPAGGLGGNNRFDNVVLSGFVLPGVNLPPLVDAEALPSGVTNLRAGLPAIYDLATIFSDPNGDELTFSATSSRPAIAGVEVIGDQLIVTGLAPGESLITIEADDGTNPPVAASFLVLVYPEAHDLAAGPFVFNEWAADNPAMSFPANMIFLQSEVPDPVITAALPRAYQIPLSDAGAPVDADFPYAASNRTRINGLGEEGISFINTGRDLGNGLGRDVGAALAAIDTTGMSAVSVGFTAETLLVNNRSYAIRLQYRVGDDGPFLDVLDALSNPVEYNRSVSGEDLAHFGPIALPAAALDEPYVQLLWRYHFLPDVIPNTGMRQQIRLDDIVISGSGFAQWRVEEFTAAELDDPLVSGPLADPTGSGVANLLRYALGLGRNDPPHAALPKLIGSGFRFPIDFGKTDITYRVTTSEDLIDWTTVLYDSREDATPAPVDGHLNLPVDFEGTHRFFRLEISQD